MQSLREGQQSVDRRKKWSLDRGFYLYNPNMPHWDGEQPTERGGRLCSTVLELIRGLVLRIKRKCLRLNYNKVYI